MNKIKTNRYRHIETLKQRLLVIQSSVGKLYNIVNQVGDDDGSIESLIADIEKLLGIQGG